MKVFTVFHETLMTAEQPINTEQPPVKRRKMSAKEEVKTTYYYVSISYPLRASSMDVESLTKVAKKYKINPVGEFDLIGQTFVNGVDHEFYLFKFNDSKPASGVDDDRAGLLILFSISLCLT